MDKFMKIHTEKDGSSSANQNANNFDSPKYIASIRKNII